MSLTLTLRNAEAAPEGTRTEFKVDGDGALIGRSRNCDWNLPDPNNIVSSRHAEIRKVDRGYVLTDISTNGTFLNSADERMSGEHLLADGDVLRIGNYEIVVSVEADIPPPPPPPLPPPPPPPPPPPSEPERTIVQPAGSPAAAEPAAAEPAHAAPAEGGESVPENVTVMWDSLADINKVDWARGGLGGKGEAAAAAAGEAGTADELVSAFVDSLALGDNEVPRSPELVAKGGSLLRRLVAGMFVMIEARARAKAQMGAEATGLQLEGNNPIKFARTPEQALARLLSPPEPGFMESGRAVEDGFLDLQSHQVATLRAIPGALRATLDRFSPGSVRRRAEKAGVLARILPALQDAALWRNYEREYVKVKNESDEAFMEVFAKEFRKAYERQLREGLEEKPERL